MGSLLDFSRAGDVFEIRAIMQASIAPAFLLTAQMGAMNMLSTRLGWVIDRERSIRRDASLALPGEGRRLGQRAQAAHAAIGGCVLAAILLCSLIVVSFIGIFLGLRVAWVLGLLLVAAMLAMIGALGLFLREIRLASHHLPLGHDD